MFFHMFLLDRDPQTRQTTFGYTTQFNFDVGEVVNWPDGTFYRPSFYASDVASIGGVWTVGQEVDRHGDVPSMIPIVKSLEYTQTKEGEISFIERLNYRAHSGWIPYRFRTICSKQKNRVASFNNRSLIHLGNLNQIFRDTTGVCEVEFTDPRIDVLHDLGGYNGIADDLDTRAAQSLEGVLTTHPLFGLVSYDANATATLQAELMHLMRDLRKEVRGQYQLSELVSHVLPTSMPHALLRAIKHGGEDDLRKNKSLLAKPPIDVSITPPLRITHPDVTHYTPLYAQQAACWLNSIRGTDFELVYYIDYFGRIGEREVHYFCDRYHALTDTNVWLSDAHHLEKAVHHLITATRSWALRQDNDALISKLHGNFFVTVTKNFSEEALVTLAQDYPGQPFHAVHFDLAVLSLCSLGTSLYTGFESRPPHL